MNNADTMGTNKSQPQVGKSENPSSPVKADPSTDKADVSKQDAKAAATKEESGTSSR
jgi:hypothetical protein